MVTDIISSLVRGEKSDCASVIPRVRQGVGSVGSVVGRDGIEAREMVVGSWVKSQWSLMLMGILVVCARFLVTDVILVNFGSTSSLPSSPPPFKPFLEVVNADLVGFNGRGVDLGVVVEVVEVVDDDDDDVAVVAMVAFPTPLISFATCR